MLKSQKAFSLAEVVIALAIAALGFVSLLGLLPQGMQMSRKAADLAAESRIVQQITAELNSTGWDKITWNSGYGPNRYFDDQGVEIASTDISNAKAAFSLSYVVSVYVPEETGTSSKKMKLPVEGAGAASVVSENYLRRVRIYVATTTNKNFSFTGAPAGSVPFSSIILSKMGTETVAP